MEPAFVHLHLHTEYSLVDGLVRIKPLSEAVAAAGMPAVAVTDQSNLFSMVKFYRAAEAAGVKPLVGVDLWVRNDREAERPDRLVLLCRTDEGFRNLTRLVSRSYLEGQHRGLPMLEREWLEGMSAGLIALSGAREGDVGRALLKGDRVRAQRLADRWAALFPESYYLELHRTGRPGDEAHVAEAVNLAQELGLPVVATNDVRFLHREDFEAHEARVCIHEGRTLDDPRRPRNYTDQQYLRTPEEMQELFSDIPEALANTVEIAKRCNVELVLGKNYLPEFPVPDGMDANSYLRAQAREGLEQRLARVPDNDAQAPEHRRVYEERLERELDVIIDMGFPGYFLIVADFIRWAKHNGIPVGPGRGSGAGSLVAFALEITDLDPIRYDLLFERFLNPERVSMPDFDVDFCMDQRDRVIDYVAERYGREKVSQIITYGSMAAKAVVRDVGRVLGYPYGYVDKIAKLIPFEVGMTLDKALTQEEDLRGLYEQDDEVAGIIDMATKLEGLARNAGKHAGGVVIAPSQLTDFTPLYCEQGAQNVVTQFDKDDVEAVGLVKFDFLGLRTLTIIKWAVETINYQREQNGEDPLDIGGIPMDDAASFELLKRCATTAVFQLESRGMKDLIKRLQPDCFEEIVALVALFRPGPLQSGMVDDFIARKHGRASIAYPHPELEPILKPTYGVILYQEQVMQIAQVLAGYSLGEADLLRRAMGKKKPEEMAKQREIFTKGAVERRVDQKTATHIFDLMEKFAGYGFNKSHSAAYAMLAYQTAWLKAHYPAAFMAAVLSSDMDNTDKVVTLIEEARDMRLQVRPPDINSSYYRFTVADEETILYGLGAIKGVGQAAIESMITERDANGRFPDLFDFCRRIELRKVNRRVLEALVRAGALDGLGPNRASLMAQLPDAVKYAEQSSRNQDAGMVDLFGGEASAVASGYTGERASVAEWDEDQRLTGEKETLGLYLTGHPIDRYEDELAQVTSGRISELTGAANGWSDGAPEVGRGARDQAVVVAGLVMTFRTVNTKRGGRMGIMTLDDRTGRIEATLFPEVFEKYRNLIAKDRVLVVQGLLGPDEYTGGHRLSTEHVYTVDQAREQFARRLVIRLGQERGGNGFIHSLADVLTPFREGHCPVWVNYRGRGASAELPLGERWRVHPTDELLHRLRELAGERDVWLDYSRGSRPSA